MLQQRPWAHLQMAARNPPAVKFFPVNTRSCTTAIAAIFPMLSPFWRPWLMEKEKAVKGAAEVSHQRAQSLGINVGVASNNWQALMAQERLVARVGSAVS